MNLDSVTLTLKAAQGSHPVEALLYSDCDGVIFYPDQNIAIGVKHDAYILRIDANEYRQRSKAKLEPLVYETARKNDPVFSFAINEWLSEFTQWEGDLYAALERILLVTRSDAQGIVMAHSFEVAKALAMDMSPNQAAMMLDNASKSSLNAGGEGEQAPVIKGKSMELLLVIDEGISKVLRGGKIAYLCHGAMGEHATDELANLNFEEEITKDSIEEIENGGQEVFEFFDTVEEAQAFWAGVRAMSGYNDFFATTFDQHVKVYPMDIKKF